MHDDAEYIKFTTRQRVDTALNTLVGLLDGVGMDGVISEAEVDRFRDWVLQTSDLRGKEPFNETIQIVEEALSDGVLEPEERDDIAWLVSRMLEGREYYDLMTTELQQLHGVLAGVMADGIITEGELRGVQDWAFQHEALKGIWPYDEVESIVADVLRDGKVDEKEQQLLMSFFGEFVASSQQRIITTAPVIMNGTVTGVCALDPEIEFPDKTFCFTGTSERYKRSELGKVVESLGGIFTKNVTKSVDYLVIGAAGNPCWAYSCYGRKVESAIGLRKQGHKVLIVHENDFLDAVEDSM